MNLQRDNHYLPQCYQEGFTDANGQLWVRFPGKEPQIRNPRSVGKKRSLYIRDVNGVEDDKIEQFLSREIETPFAYLVQRIKNEREQFGSITAQEQAALLKFVASQTVRTLGHRRCIDVQAGREVDRATFHQTMLRQMYTMLNVWGMNPPKLRFFTTVPLVSDHFISGDNPVYVVFLEANPVWTPTEEPQQKITKLTDLLDMPNVGFWLHLSPYIAVSVEPRDAAQTFFPPESIEPRRVRLMNQLLRGQCSEFVLARDRASLN
jgi:hypothetical protein